jgi:hypothetical protein
LDANLDWKDILIEYGRMLAGELRKSSFIAESRLPCQKWIIKKAIFAALADAEAGRRNLESHLENAYVNLAQFVADDDMAVVTQVEEGLLSLGAIGENAPAGVQGQQALKQVADRLEPLMERYRRIHDDVRRRQDAYRREFQARSFE